MSDPLVTEAEVREIIDVPSSISFTPFIAVAHRIVVDRLEDLDIEDETLKEIERWLSAHFTAIRDMRRSQENIGRASVGYQYYVHADLRNTMYGQQAIIMDPTGTLATLGKKKISVGMSWLGTDYDEEDEDQT